MSILDLRVWLAAILALVLAYGGGRLQQKGADSRRFEAEKTAALAKAQADHIAQLNSARQEEQRRTDEQRKIADDANSKLTQARADATAANDSAGRLRKRIKELLAANSASKDSASTGGSQATGTTDALLAELFRRADARAGSLAADLDASRLAGHACARAYDSLVP